jgi:YVTN family beta-propeller protein
MLEIIISLPIISIIPFPAKGMLTTSNTLDAHTLDRIVNQTNVFKGTSQINVGHHPRSISIAPHTNTVYVANYDSGSVSVIDADNDTKLKDIPVGTSPVSIAVDPDSDKVYVANSNTRNVSVIDGTTNTKLKKDIPVGGKSAGGSSIAIDSNTHKVYVANFNTGNVSVIDGTTNTKLKKDIPVGRFLVSIALDRIPLMVYTVHGPNVSVINGTSNTKLSQDIPVGGGSHPAMALDTDTGTLYVANFGRRSVSVVSIDNDTKLKDIPVGGTPRSIAVNENTHTVYVANYDSASVSVINGTSNTKLSQDIPVGDSPRSIAVNPDTDTVYVANEGSDGVSVIDGVTNKVVAGVTFNINPSNSGRIICNNKDAPINQYFYLFSGTTCTATPNQGFEFSSWVENLKHNSTRTIKASQISYSPLNPLLNTFGKIPNDTESTINTQFGSFTANFKALPPPIPPAYWIPLYGVILSSIVGWSIPSIIGWIKAKRQGGKLHQYYKRINSLYDNGILDENDAEPLDTLKTAIKDAYTKGKISDLQYNNLKNEISILYEKIYKNKIDSLSGKSDSSNGILLEKIKNDVTDAYAEEKISEQHYNLLNAKICDFKNNQEHIGKLSSFQKVASKTVGSPIKFDEL